MTRTEAEDYIYASYLRAEKYHDFYAGDKEKRNPKLSQAILEKKSKTPCVVITGSKGKGSMSCMISQILQSRLRVGLMTSPHIINFCERFQIDGISIADDDFTKYMELIKEEFEPIEQTLSKREYISPIGIQAALALQYFNDKQTDFNVFECGKGVKYDDVSNIKHTYAVIGSIFLEHTRELGSTLEEIAEDKACVINGEQKCVYIAKQVDAVKKILLERAEKLHVPAKVYGRDFEAVNIRYTRAGMLFDVRVGDRLYENIQVPLLGIHQAMNCALAMAICQDILGGFDLDRVKEKLATLNWAGRMEILCEEPFVMLDACINRESSRNVKNVLNHLQIERYDLIVGIPDDKDYFGVIEMLAEHAENIILTKSQNFHYVFTEKQKHVLAEAKIFANWSDSLEEALDMVREKKPLLILGTTSLVSEVKKFYAKKVTEQA